ncbi:MAG TPA: LacI family transcriptional regulator [Chloroflexi bacterium]|nr:LacI family transcriptional regulator [Chloroflexota bacterium]HHW88349.1 LacI family transcriptional regulator [Chloroflexota bacterium]
MTHVSIVDIARLAQVSPSTVSRALQNHPRISPERRAEILALAEQLGYRPSQVARSLVTGQTHTIGVVASDVTDPFVAEVLKGVESAARSAGYGLLIAMSNRDPSQEITAATVLLDHQVDGLIVISSRAPDRYRQLPRARENAAGGVAPVVLLNHDFSEAGVYSVRMDNAGAASAAVTLLSQLGHRHIAFVAGPGGGQSSHARLAGYLQGLAANHLTPLPELILQGAGMLEDGWEALTALQTMQPRPTAVLCYNDLAAIGLLAAAARSGVSVPDALSVVGFDNVPLSAYTVPALTTVEQPKAAMGQAAVRTCLRALAGEPAPPIVMSGQIVLRASTGVCRLSDRA